MRARLLQASRRTIAAVISASLMLAVPVPALAGVESEMQSFMNEMGAQANVTGPSAYQGQSAGYYSGGAMWARFPQKNIQPFNLQLPHARAGCGGIDLFAGSFSFINTAELVAMLKATANNALAFAFKLAYDMFITPPEAVLSPGKDSAIDINSLTSNLFQVVVKVILLIVMAAIGSMVANRGIKLYASPRKGVAKPKAEKPKEKSAKTDA